MHSLLHRGILTMFHGQNFIIQGGDPTGTGHGGESAGGKPFKDEFHQRLKFLRRGLVGMANSKPNDNASQVRRERRMAGRDT